MILHSGAEEQGFLEKKNITNCRKCSVGLEIIQELKYFYVHFFHIFLLSSKSKKKEELGDFREKNYKIIKRHRFVKV